MTTLSRRRFLRLPLAVLSAALPATALAQGYPYYGQESDPPPMTTQQIAEEIKNIKWAQVLLRADRNMDRTDIDAIKECVTGCHMILPGSKRA